MEERNLQEEVRHFKKFNFEKAEEIFLQLFAFLPILNFYIERMKKL